jgi:hypothetical protein
VKNSYSQNKGNYMLTPTKSSSCLFTNLIDTVEYSPEKYYSHFIYFEPDYLPKEWLCSVANNEIFGDSILSSFTVYKQYEFVSEHQYRVSSEGEVLTKNSIFEIVKRKHRDIDIAHLDSFLIENVYFTLAVYQNSELYSLSIFLNKKLVVAYRWYEDGKLASKETIPGTLLVYNREGKLVIREERSHDNAKKMYYEKWNDNGVSFICTGFYMNFEMDSTWRYYSKDGKIEKEEIWREGKLLNTKQY